MSRKEWGEKSTDYLNLLYIKKNWKGYSFSTITFTLSFSSFNILRHEDVYLKKNV